MFLQVTKVLRKMLTISLVNYFFNKTLFSQWKSNIECWVFLTPLTHLYVSIEIP